MTGRIDMCKFYTTSMYPSFKPKCLKHRKASLKCHSKRLDCPEYKPTSK